MRLQLTEDDGTLLEDWFVPNSEPRGRVTGNIEDNVPVFDDEEEASEALGG